MDQECYTEHWTHLPPGKLADCVANGAYGFLDMIVARLWLLGDDNIAPGEVALVAIVVGLILYNVKRRRAGSAANKGD